MSSIVIEPMDGESTASDVRTRSLQRRLSLSRVRRGLVAVDAAASVALLGLLDAGEGPSVRGGASAFYLGVAVAAIISLGLLAAFGAYSPGSRLPGARLRMTARQFSSDAPFRCWQRLSQKCPGGTLDAASVVVVGLLLSGCWILARVAVGFVERRHPVRTLVVGTGISACEVWRLAERHRECAIEIVGFIDDDPLLLPSEAPATLGPLGDLARIVKEQAVERVIVAYANAIDADLLPVLRSLDDGVQVQVLPRLFDLVQARGFELGRISILDAGGVAPGRAERLTKRAFDVVAASTLLVVLAPLLAVIALAVRFDDRGPVIFRQRRVGRHQRPFDIYKFRTMQLGAERAGREIIDGRPIDEAVRELKRQSSQKLGTRIGRYLRPAGLDELPQLWNVLRGDMSLVGPRPLRDFEVTALGDLENTTRHSIRPGITGVWQVSGRDATTWEERIKLDCMYARHWSMTSDLRILARTVGAVAGRHNAV